MFSFPISLCVSLMVLNLSLLHIAVSDMYVVMTLSSVFAKSVVREVSDGQERIPTRSAFSTGI